MRDEAKEIRWSDIKGIISHALGDIITTKSYRCQGSLLKALRRRRKLILHFHLLEWLSFCS
jgi:hypothetical protein